MGFKCFEISYTISVPLVLLLLRAYKFIDNEKMNWKKKNTFLIGCSGYYYPQWKGTFYPEKLPPSKWLEHYSRVFNTVELNGTFYRTPKPADLERQFNNVPDEFKFSVKISRYITHVLKLKNTAGLIKEFKGLIEDGLSEKLHKFLFQMPPSFHYTDENLELILKNIPPGPQHVIELRHASWWDKKVEQNFKKNDYTFCNVSYPKLPSDFIKTSDDFYLRMHGVPELFKSTYKNEELKALQENLPVGKSYTIYFNNTYYDAGHKNALELLKMVKG